MLQTDINNNTAKRRLSDKFKEGSILNFEDDKDERIQFNRGNEREK